ncbi:MAG TPA: serine hydrolase [Syntrophales bacterium]|nr:serine hydrolase [Syntrophales bacterium]
MKRILFVLILGFLFLATAQPAFSLSQKVIRAKACIIINDDDSILYAKNPSAKLPPASTVKLVTAMVALDYLDPAMEIIVTKYTATPRSIKPRLKVGDKLTVSDLLHLVLMKSINSAAVALAEATSGSEDVFVELMNQKALDIGANDTHFENASGLPKGTQYTTARDLTIILKHALTYPLIKEIIGKKEAVITTTAGRELYMGNTDALLWYRSNMVGGKTGFTRSARHCFVGAMYTDKGLIYTAVLGAPSRSRLWTGTLILADMSANPDLLNTIDTIDEPLATRNKKYRHHKQLKSKKKAKHVNA